MWLNSHLHQYKRAHKYNGWRGTQISQLETRPSPSPPVKDSAPWAGETLVPLTQCGKIAADHFIDWRGYLLGDVEHLVCRGRAFWDHTRLIMGCLGEEPEGSRRAGKKQIWKNKEIKVWKGPVIGKQGLTGTPVCPFPTYVLHSLPCLLIQLPL